VEILCVHSARWWQAQKVLIGREGRPLVIIDNFHPLPTVCVDDADRRSFRPVARHYPGIRAPVPKPYFAPVRRGLSDILIHHFDYRGGVSVQECFYSLLTTPPAQLNYIQRLPHVDGGDDRKVAILHYLCYEHHGGTAFFRQRRTGFETVPNDRFAAYKQGVEADHDSLGAPTPQYYTRNDRRFDRIRTVKARYNRAILYFGSNLHTILPGTEDSFSDDPRIGRLTVNTFVHPAHAGQKPPGAASRD